MTDTGGRGYDDVRDAARQLGAEPEPDGDSPAFIAPDEELPPTGS